MTDTLTAIDRAVDGLCPCGGEPRPGSIYCGDDCTPTHIGPSTDRRETGQYATPMRWRPDLVTAADDSQRTLISEHRRGAFNAQVYEYPDSDQLHFRLEDGYRFVGSDIDGLNGAAQYREDAWQRLEREMANSRHLETDPWADAFGPHPIRPQHPATVEFNSLDLTPYLADAGVQVEQVTAADDTTLTQVQAVHMWVVADPAISNWLSSVADRLEAHLFSTYVLAGDVDPRVRGTVFTAPQAPTLYDLDHQPYLWNLTRSVPAGFGCALELSPLSLDGINLLGPDDPDNTPLLDVITAAQNTAAWQTRIRKLASTSWTRTGYASLARAWFVEAVTDHRRLFTANIC